ncbi:leucine-rich repeat-containing protein 20 isoform X1 [Dendropsophus ebraccatus]|uniref:leucine-rich repeat-containing protein 20 isoform X1 n=1 Tax=Dendropsophus ebraccatus TaxID=150705 RepID=UPI0038312EA9
MAEAVARVARRVNEVVENGGHHLDLSECALSSFPTGLYLAVNTVTDQIYSISLANNELKILAGKFFTTFKALQELNIEGNFLEKLPHEAGLLCNLKMINLARNKLDTFPDELTKIQCIENINLEGNQIKAHRVVATHQEIISHWLLNLCVIEDVGPTAYCNKRTHSSTVSCVVLPTQLPSHEIGSVNKRQSTRVYKECNMVHILMLPAGSTYIFGIFPYIVIWLIRLKK